MKIAITGGAGFIGSHLSGLCLQSGIPQVVIDDLSVGKLGNIPPDVPFVQADVRDTAALAQAFAGCDTVCHLAARVSIRGAVARFVDDADVNVMGTLSALQAAQQTGIRRFIYASSMAVYGDPVYSPQDENHPLVPTSPYGAGKRAGELYVLTLTKLWGMEGMALRYFNTYGPRQTPSPYVGVLTIFIQRCLAGDPPQIFGDGLQSRDFVHVGDVAEATLRAAQSPLTGTVLNIGTGVPTTINEVADMVIAATGAQVRPEYLPPAAGEPADSLADITALRDAFGWYPQTALEDKLDEVVEWNRDMQFLVESGSLSQG
ncbi:MAG TPA: NAD-dependent epimerase/dehydratase family protein [bacterium]|nr:NAD-dependent epimerase/dehydratase family protein [bacterium]